MHLLPASARRIRTTAIALVSVAALVLGSAMASALAWAATTVLVIPGTGTQNPGPVPHYEGNAVQYYVAPTGACATDGCATEPVPYLAQFWPIPLNGWGGLTGAKWNDSVASGVTSVNTVYSGVDHDSPAVIFGYSQGATVGSEVKRQWAAQPGGIPENVSFVLIANPDRPNGGLFTRLGALNLFTTALLNASTGRPTPTNTSTVINTTDVGFQYDGVTDFPRYPLNPLATLNALAGFWYVHGTYLAPKGTDATTDTPIGYTPAEVSQAVANATASCTAATYCQISGDTRYVTLPARILPIMLPVLDLADTLGATALVRPIIDLTSPIARVLIETGYTRDDYGKYTPAGIIPTLYPVSLGTDLITGAVAGVDAAITGTGDASRYLEAKKNAQSSAAPTTSSTTTDAQRVTAISTGREAPSTSATPTPSPAPTTAASTSGATSTTGTTASATTSTADVPTTQPTPTTQSNEPSAKTPETVLVPAAA